MKEIKNKTSVLFQIQHQIESAVRQSQESP